MEIFTAIAAVCGIVGALLPFVLKRKEAKDEIKKSSFDLGLSELDAANQRMRLDVDQHGNLTVQPGGSAEDSKR